MPEAYSISSQGAEGRFKSGSDDTGRSLAFSEAVFYNPTPMTAQAAKGPMSTPNKGREIHDLLNAAIGKLSPEQLIAEIEDISRTMPPIETLHHTTPENLSWIGRFSAFVEAWELSKTLALSMAVSDLHRPMGDHHGARAQIQILLHQAKSDLRLKTLGPVNIAVGQGLAFDYFDGVRKIIEPARSDLFFIDRYMEADFVSRYLPHVAPGVSIRLLARDRIPVLRSAVEAFVQQTGATVHIRSANDFHDRYVIVDRLACYQSGASFKDGAKSAPTTLTQITDAFQAVLQTYETIWASAKVER